LPPQKAPPPPWPTLLVAVAVAVEAPVDAVDPPEPEAEAPLLFCVSTEPLQALIVAARVSAAVTPARTFRVSMKSS
jgi:hypothetical protein